MASSTSIVLLTYTLLTLTLTSAQICYTTGNFTTNSTYAQNRNLILSSLASNTTLNSGFYTSTIGHDSEMVYALALCRGDLSTEICFNCINSSSHEINQGCPNQKEAVGWANNKHQCIVHVSDKSLVGNMEYSPDMIVHTSNNITIDNVDEFDLAFDALVADLVNRAAMGSSRLKFATGHTKLDSFQNLYALVQCTPDLSSTDCWNCLNQTVKDYRSCCAMKQPINILRPSCIFHYDLDQFYETTINDAPSPRLPPPPTPTSGKWKISTQTIIAIVATICSSVVIFSLCHLYLVRKGRKKYSSIGDENVGHEINVVQSLQYNLHTIEAASNNFSLDNKIGEGGFGEVYKGTLPNGQEIAMKRLSKCSRQGAEEFKNEVVLVAKLQHKNLVRLLGFCLEQEEKILVYEYVPNKSLDYFLFDPRKQGQLDWPRRYNIIEGIARGILYLHEDSQLRIIHRDLKASNILLNADMKPKISDFGMARIFGVDQTQANTSRVVGTFGYMAPEYVVHGHFSTKSDVFSFGVLILEIITGKKNSSFYQSDCAEDLLTYAWKHWRNGTPLELMDPPLGDSYSINEFIRCIHIGLLCVQEDVDARPSMATIVILLNRFSVTLEVPKQPPFFLGSRTNSRRQDQAVKNARLDSVNEASITQQYPR